MSLRAFTAVCVCFAGLILSERSYAEVDAEDCISDLQRVFSTEVTCRLDWKPDKSLSDKLKEVSHGVIEGMKCSTPLQFQKKQVYSEWIKLNKIRLPHMQVDCNVTGSVESKAELSALSINLQPYCTRQSQNHWNCELGVTQVNQIGMLGSVIKKALNSNAAIKEGLSQWVEQND